MSKKEGEPAVGGKKQCLPTLLGARAAQCTAQEQDHLPGQHGVRHWAGETRPGRRVGFQAALASGFGAVAEQ